MATYTVKRWRCDCCGIEADIRPRTGADYSITATVDHRSTGGVVFQWDELCPSCNQMVGELIKTARRKRDEARTALRSEEEEA